jgi:hypothetical protein
MAWQSGLAHLCLFQPARLRLHVLHQVAHDRVALCIARPPRALRALHALCCVGGRSGEAGILRKKRLRVCFHGVDHRRMLRRDGLHLPLRSRGACLQTAAPCF